MNMNKNMMNIFATAGCMSIGTIVVAKISYNKGWIDGATKVHKEVDKKLNELIIEHEVYKSIVEGLKKVYDAKNEKEEIEEES